jgi:hypothetical protein
VDVEEVNEVVQPYGNFNVIHIEHIHGKLTLELPTLSLLQARKGGVEVVLVESERIAQGINRSAPCKSDKSRRQTFCLFPNLIDIEYAVVAAHKGQLFASDELELVGPGVRDLNADELVGKHRREVAARLGRLDEHQDQPVVYGFTGKHLVEHHANAAIAIFVGEKMKVILEDDYRAAFELAGIREERGGFTAIANGDPGKSIRVKTPATCHREVV